MRNEILITIGALDGKHILIRSSPTSGSYYYNYKKTFSIVLMALVDASYRRVSDSGVFKNCSVYYKLEQNSLNLPEPLLLLGTQMSQYVIVVDEQCAAT